MHFITKVCFWWDKSVGPLSVVYLGNIVQQGFKYLFTSTYPRFTIFGRINSHLLFLSFPPVVVMLLTPDHHPLHPLRPAHHQPGHHPPLPVAPAAGCISFRLVSGQPFAQLLYQ